MKAANAQTELRLDSLAEVRQQLGLDVWNGYHAVKGTTENLHHSATLLALSRRSHGAALRRYQSGVGGILELLHSQSALARAKQQQIEALTEWRGARLQLAAALGQLEMSHLDGTRGKPRREGLGFTHNKSFNDDGCLPAKTPATPDARPPANEAP